MDGDRRVVHSGNRHARAQKGGSHDQEGSAEEDQRPEGKVKKILKQIASQLSVIVAQGNINY
jgi:hypothetical protein